MDKGAKDKLAGSLGENGGGQDDQKDLHSRTGRDENEEEDPRKDGKKKQKEIFQLLGVRRWRELATFIHSFSSLSYDRSKASSKASSPHSAIQSFLLQMRVSSPFLKVIQQLPASSSSSSCHFYPPFIFPSITRCRRQFLRKM